MPGDVGDVNLGQIPIQHPSFTGRNSLTVGSCGLPHALLIKVTHVAKTMVFLA